MRKIIERTRFRDGSPLEESIFPHQESVKSIRVRENFVVVDRYFSTVKIPMANVLAIHEVEDLSKYIFAYKAIEKDFKDISPEEVKKSLEDIAQKVRSKREYSSDDAITQLCRYDFTEREANIALDIAIEFGMLSEEEGLLEAP